MGVWPNENSVITSIGQEILSKVQMGVGKITLSKIMTGAGRVSVEELVNQIGVTDPRQEALILTKQTTRNGSGIEIKVANENVTESYNLNQLGIYVRHPDYTGDQLYIISQTKEENPDYVPTFDETLTSLYYSVWIAHEQTDNFVIEVNPAGSLPMHMRGESLGVCPLDLFKKVPSEFLPDEFSHGITAAIMNHNGDSFSHLDIRNLINQLQERLDTIENLIR